MKLDAEYNAPVRSCNVVNFSSVGTDNPGMVTEKGVRSSCFFNDAANYEDYAASEIYE
jgi:hypothetical protein